MKKLLLVCLLAVSPLLAAPEAASDPAPAIEWSSDIETAIARSAKENRPVMAYFTYDGCPWCARVDKEVLSDPRVLEQASRFIWVRLDRDLNWDAHDRYYVREYPTFLTLNGSRQNVLRVRGFRDADEFLGVLADAADRYRRLAAGEHIPDIEAQEEMIADLPGIQTVPTPTDKVPTGICVLGDDIWLMQDKSLHQIDKKTGELKYSVPIETPIADITTDGQVLFLAAFGWTKGEPILVFHPGSGKFVRHIVTEKYAREPHGYRTHGIAYHDGALWLLALAQLHKVDPSTGNIVSWKSVEPSYRSLQSVGDKLATGSPEGVVFLDPASLDVSRRIRTKHPVRGVTADPEGLYLAGQPSFDFDRYNNRVMTWPHEMVIFRLPRESGTAKATVVD